MCNPCENGWFNSIAGAKCRKCPAHTHSTMDRTSCEPFDMVSESGNLYPIHQVVRPDFFCRDVKNSQICKEESDQIGPIPASYESSMKGQSVFYFTNREPLITDRYEFHTSKFAAPLTANASYVYMLLELKNAPANLLTDYILNSN